MYFLPDNALKTEILMYSLSIYSIVQADPSLIQLSTLYEICWKDLFRPYLLWLITVLE